MGDEKAVVELEDIFNMMQYADIAISLKMRFSYILSSEITIEELLNGAYVSLGSEMQELIKVHWSRFALGIYLNLSCMGNAPFYFHATRLKGKKMIIPVSLFPGEYKMTLKQTKSGEVEKVFKMKGNVQATKIHNVASLTAMGPSLHSDYVHSEMGMILEAYKDLMQRKELETVGIRLAVNPPLYLQRQNVDPIRSIQEETARLDAHIMSTMDESGYVNMDTKEEIRRDASGVNWIPAGYVPSAHQHRIETKLLDTSSAQVQFKNLVERSLGVRTHDATGMYAHTRAPIDEAHMNLEAVLKGFCADISQVMAAAYKIIYDGSNPRVTLKHTTRISTEMLISLHNSGAINSSILKEHAENNLGVHPSKRLKGDEKKEEKKDIT